MAPQGAPDEAYDAMAPQGAPKATILPLLLSLGFNTYNDVRASANVPGQAAVVRCDEEIQQLMKAARRFLETRS